MTRLPTEKRRRNLRAATPQTMQKPMRGDLCSMTSLLRLCAGPDARFYQATFTESLCVHCPHWTDRLGKSDQVTFPGQQLAGKSTHRLGKTARKKSSADTTNVSWNLCRTRGGSSLILLTCQEGKNAKRLDTLDLSCLYLVNWVRVGFPAPSNASL